MHILNIHWQDKIPDTEALERARLPIVITTVRKAQTRWAGHVFRMTDVKEGRRPAQALQRLPESLPQGLQHRHHHMGKRRI